MISNAALVLLAVAAAPPAANTATSPDGRDRAWVKTDPGAGSGDDARSTLWITDTRTGRSHVLLRGRPANTPERTTASFQNPHFSLDGGFVYIDADAWATSSAVHQVDVRTGAERFVAPGGLIGVIRTGPWRGYLLIQQHRYWPTSGSYNPVLVYRPDGKEIVMVPGSAQDDGETAVAPWLRAKGWRAS